MNILNIFTKGTAKFVKNSQPPTWLAAIFTILLISPKLNLIQIGGQTSGIRFDDIFLLLVTPYLLSNISKTLPAIQGLRLYIIFILGAIISALWNLDIHEWKPLLYPIRLIEYLAFLILGALFANRQLLIRISLGIILLNTATSIGQMFFGWGGFPYSQYSTGVGARAIGLTAGPWEMAAIVNLALAYLAYAWGKVRHYNGRFLFIYIIALVCQILSGSRVGIVVNTSIVCIYIVSLENGLRFRALMLGGTLLTTALIFTITPNSLSERSRDIFKAANLEQAQRIKKYENGSCHTGKAGDVLDFAVVNDGKHDPSWGVRAQKWATAACIFRGNSSNYVMGLGPGFFGPALDGGFVRVTVEQGVMGIILLLASLIGFDPAFRKYRLISMTFAAHMVFIDIYLSYKFMSFLFFILGTQQMINNHIEAGIEHAATAN